MRRNRQWVGSLTITALVALLVCCGVASATPLNMVTGKTLGVRPGQTGILPLSIINVNSGAVVTDFNGWSSGLQLIPQAGATGTATIAAAALPATNAALTDPEVPLTLLPNQTLSVAANGTTSYTFITSANQSAATTTFALGQTYNVADLSISLGANASGTWNLYAVNNANGIASWQNPSGTATDFGNVAKSNGDAGTVLIGTVSAVPEPEGVTLAVSAMSGLVWFVIRSRRKAASAVAA